MRESAASNTGKIWTEHCLERREREEPRGQREQDEPRTEKNQETKMNQENRESAWSKWQGYIGKRSWGKKTEALRLEKFLGVRGGGEV